MKSNQNSPLHIRAFSNMSLSVVKNSFFFFLFPKETCKGFCAPLDLKLLFLRHYSLLLKISVGIVQLIQKLLGEEGRQTECKFNILSKQKFHQLKKSPKPLQKQPNTTGIFLSVHNI